METRTFQLATELFLQTKRTEWSSEGTAVWYAHQLRLLDQFLQTHQVTRIDENTLRQYLLYRKSQVRSSHTLHCTYRALHAFFRWCQQEGLVQQDLLAHTKPPRRDEPIKPVLSVDDVHKLLHHAGEGWLRERNTALLLFLLDTGARLSEALRVRVRDLRAESVTVRGKGGKARTLHMATETRLAILRYLEACPHQPTADDPLWWGAYGPLTEHGTKMILEKLGERAGLPFRLGPHCFRRTYASWALQDGMSLEHLRLSMGHSDIRVTETYIRLDDSDLRETHRRFSPINRLRRARRKETRR